MTLRTLGKKNILLISFAVEAALGSVFVIWAWLRSYQDHLFPSLGDLMCSLVLAAVLLLANLFLFGVLANRVPWLHFCVCFVDEVIKPLADLFDWKAGLFIACCAGVGEELFFRGVLQNEFGLLAASILFSLLHFGTAVVNYLFIAFVYFAVGVCLGLSYSISGTLWVPVCVHIMYDYIALLYLHYVYVRNATPEFVRVGKKF
jgi:membrane protease YdiL (CAAX protease family)